MLRPGLSTLIPCIKYCACYFEKFIADIYVVRYFRTPAVITSIIFYGVWLFIHALTPTSVWFKLKLGHGLVITFCCFTWIYLIIHALVHSFQQSLLFCIWVGSRRCGCLVTWFCYQMIAKPGNKTVAPSWPGPVIYPLNQYVHIPHANKRIDTNVSWW